MAIAVASMLAVAADAGARSNGGWLVTLRPAEAFPGGVALTWRTGGERSWAVGVEFDEGGGRLQGVWTGPQWPLGPDTLSRFSVRVGYELATSEDAGGSPGLWVGVWAGQQWVRRPFMVQFGTEIRVPTGAWQSPRWITSAGIGLAW